MAGKHRNKVACGVRLTRKWCAECEHTNHFDQAPTECAFCGAPLAYWCQRGVEPPAERCDLHQGRTDVHEDAALTPDAYVRMRLAMSGPDAPRVYDKARQMPPAERANELAALAFTLAATAPAPDRETIDSAVWAQESAQRTAEVAAKTKALAEGKLPELQTKRDMSTLTDEELAQAKALARKMEGKAP